jgi:predicted membrane-bound mannosyltransferase
VPDFLRLAQRVADVAAVHAEGPGMLVKVIAGPYEQWPAPWYLRRMSRVGYWPTSAAAGRIDDATVVIAAPDQADAVDAALGDRYVQEHYGLRPEVILTMFIERGAWDRFIASRGAP